MILIKLTNYSIYERRCWVLFPNKKLLNIDGKTESPKLNTHTTANNSSRIDDKIVTETTNTAKEALPKTVKFTEKINSNGEENKSKNIFESNF